MCCFCFNDTETTESYTYDTLFPYTTLFRSVDRINAEALGRHQDGGHGADLVAVEDLRNLAGRIAMDDDAALGDDRGVLEFGAGAGVDRGLEQRLETRGLFRRIGGCCLRRQRAGDDQRRQGRSEGDTSEPQTLMRTPYAVLRFKK